VCNIRLRHDSNVGQAACKIVIGFDVWKVRGLVVGYKPQSR
jgi:hypothetical protein